MKEMNSIARLILQKAAQEGEGFGLKKNPAVLSCGGMYLPRPGAGAPVKVIYHVLNLANQKEPIKLYTGRRPFMNVLHQALVKESMN